MTDSSADELARLRSLVESFSQLNSSLVLDTVLESTLDRATELTAAAVGSVALVDGSGAWLHFVQSTDRARDRLKELRIPIDKGIAGHVARTGQAVRVEDCYGDPRFYGAVDETLGTRTRTYLCIPLCAHGEVIGTIQILNRKDGGSFTERDQEILEGFAQQAALAIRNARHHELRLRQQAIESELELCAQIQANFFPRAQPDLEGYEVLGTTVPCREVGGDYYTFVHRADGSLELVQADVAGKGIAAALTVSEIHCAVHLLADVEGGLVERMERLNRHLGKSLPMGRFASLAAFRLEPGTGDLEAFVAGHVSPRIVEASGAVRSILRTRPVLGPGPFQRRLGNESRLERLGPGDLLLAFTDGYSDADDPEGRLFGEARVVEVVREVRHRPLSEIRSRLHRELEAFQRGAPPADDMSLLMLRRGG